GDVALDDAINKWSEGMKLANDCNEILENANETITKALNNDGKLEKFDIE
ncbi:MAG: exodeoxyribonuclease VII small subunit, partial [Bacilli bacterium]